MKKKILFVTVMMFTLLISGCYDVREPNDIAYIVALGIDTTEEENIYEYTIQFAKTTQISGGSSEEGGKQGSDMLSKINVKAPTVYSGINIANQVVSKRFTLAHTKVIVISEDIAKNSIMNVFDAFGRNSDIRPNVYLAVSNGKAKDYLEEVKPVAEVNPVLYYRLIYESEYGGYVPKTVMKDFYFQLDGIDKQNVLPIAGVNKENKKKNKEEKSSEKGNSEKSSDSQQESSNEGHKKDENNVKINEQGFDFLIKEYIGGEIDVEKENASEVMGMAIFKGDKMIGVMSGIESLLYNILTGQFEYSYTSFYHDKTPELPITISMEQKKPPTISVDISGKPKAKINIFLEGQLMSESVEFPVEEDIETLEKKVTKEIEGAIKKFLYRTSKEFDSDIIGFGQSVKKNFLTYDEFEKYDWYSHYSETEFNVNVDFQLTRIGFIDIRKEGHKK